MLASDRFRGLGPELAPEEERPCPSVSPIPASVWWIAGGEEKTTSRLPPFRPRHRSWSPPGPLLRHHSRPSVDPAPPRVVLPEPRRLISPRC